MTLHTFTQHACRAWAFVRYGGRRDHHQHDWELVMSNCARRCKRCGHVEGIRVQSPIPPTHLPATAPPTFALPEKRRKGDDR